MEADNNSIIFWLIQYSTVRTVRTVQYSTVQYSTVQYSTVQYSTVQYSTVQYSTVISKTKLVANIKTNIVQLNKIDKSKQFISSTGY